MTATDSRPVVRSQVEPRIVERRRTVLEAQRRRRRLRWIALAAVVAVVAAAVGILWSPLVDVDRVSVRGADQIDDAELARVSGIRTGDHLAVVDLVAARERLRREPLVAAAQVERIWPDTVRITVVEEFPAVRIRAGEDDAVVSTTGRVLPDGVPGTEGLPVLEVPTMPEGAELSEELGRTLVVFARVPSSLRPVLSTGRLDESGELTFALDDDATVLFGRVEDVPAKLLAVQAFVEQVQMQCLDVLDVRQPGRPTASRIAGCAVPAPTEVDPAAPDPGSQDGERPTTAGEVDAGSTATSTTTP